jgi:hypothetical protein
MIEIIIMYTLGFFTVPIGKWIISRIRMYLWVRRLNNAKCPNCESTRSMFFDLQRSERQLICLECKTLFEP